jgi:ComF family protein
MSILTKGFDLQLPQFWAARLGAFLGQDCVLCASGSRALVCGECAASLPRALAEREDVVAAFAYRFPVDRLVQRFKFAGDLAVGRWLGEALAGAAARAPRPALLVVPPSTRERLRSRGFNPALEIAKATARALGIDCARDAVIRIRETQPQPGLGRSQRRRNLEGAFGCARDLSGLHVAIVDDVMTTGATVDAVTAVLRRAGASRVSVWVAARTPPRSQGTGSLTHE